MNTPLFVTTVFIQSFSFLCKENAQIITPSPHHLKTNTKTNYNQKQLNKDRICIS